MSMIDTGTYGAKVQSWRTANPRDLLRQVVEENPGADKVSLLRLLRDRVRQDESEAFLDSIIEYWFTNNYHSLVERPATARIERKAARAAAVDAAKATIQQTIEERAEQILLDMVMPNGKALRDCTGRDCRKAGGWLLRVADRIKPGDKVGAVLDEAQVRRLFRG